MEFPSFAVAIVCCWIYLLGLVDWSLAQSTTDPSEARALNSIFQQWGLSESSQWNISGEVCSGRALTATDADFDGDFNPAVICDCSGSTNGSTCHITHLKVYALNVVGVIPEELSNLTFLTHLKLDQNYLTGPLPAFIGNLTRLKVLSIALTTLSGEVPKELGDLTELTLLSFGHNNFSGSLPPELGKLTKLEQIYINSAGVSGEIPSTFANLRNLQTVWAMDIQLTGRIPDFIGNWTNLISLRFQGNAFVGSIPSTFSSLTSMADLRICDLSNNGSSSLDFLKDMKALTTLKLRNNNISDSIPSNIGEYQKLQELDLSFNSLTGELPSSLLNLSELAYLFLGNNQLSGTLPSLKSESLRNIDLSYNGLSGSFPSWVTEEGLQLNLVANNFTIDSSNSSGLPSGLKCLQRNFPCNRGSPLYSTFAINSGGLEIESSQGILYESDNANLSAASYYVTDTERWGVSSVGRFAENKNPNYAPSSSSQFTSTLDSELFQSARQSPGSLRYYGLGLENGNYTVNLQFAEILFPNSLTWQSLGKRVFDIYVQGNLLQKDFDIRKEAGETSFKAVSKEIHVLVSENFLEIHLFWAGKGTCCIPAQGTYGPLISAISVTPDFNPTVSNTPLTNSKKNNRTGLIVGIVVGIGVVGILFVSVLFFLIRRKRRPATNDDEEFLGMSTRPNFFSYSELRTATEDFNPSNKLGEGGFGPVFKGTLSDGRVVAVKQLSVTSNQGKSQFAAEIATISAVQHRNLVKLYGCCIEGDKRLLVYEYHQNKSLDQALFGKSVLHLSWSIRYDICLGMARGLAYLHEESRPRIVHRDVKASNILLDDDLNPKISDFGLAKLYDDKKTHISTRVAGTIGYLAPEYAMRGHLTEKADVFGFGVVALEILSGRLNHDSSLDEEKIYLLEWAWHLHENNRGLELVDPKLSEFNGEEAIRVIGVALLCTQASPLLRPSMSRVVNMLSGDIEVSTVTVKPAYLTDWKLNDISNYISDDTLGTLTAATSNSQSNLSNPSMVFGEQSPLSTTQPNLHEIIGEGR